MVTISLGHVVRLQKSLYGLKQAAWSWAETLAKVLTTTGFHPFLVDQALFTNGSEFLGVHVDNLLYNLQGDHTFKPWLNSHFNVKAMGLTRYLLSIELNWNSTRTQVRLSQKQYITRLIHKWLPSCSRNIKTPLLSSETLLSTVDSKA